MSAAGGRREKAAHYSSSLRETVMSFLYYHIIDQSELKTMKTFFSFVFPRSVLVIQFLTFLLDHRTPNAKQYLWVSMSCDLQYAALGTHYSLRNIFLGSMLSVFFKHIIPFNTGQITAQALMAPRLRYWPRASSR